MPSEKKVNPYKSNFEINIQSLKDSLKNCAIRPADGLISKEEFFIEISKLSVVIQELEKAAFERFPSNWKKLYYLSEDVSLAIQLLEQEGSNAKYIQSIRLSIEEKIIEYATPINFIKRFFFIRHKRATESNFIVSKIAYGLTISSSISFALLLFMFLGRTIYLSFTNRFEFVSLSEDITYLEFRLDRAEDELSSVDNSEIEVDLLQKVDRLHKQKQQKEDRLAKLDSSNFNTSLDDTLILLIAIASGALGSIVSIFIRIKDFEITEQNYDDPVIPILIGLFRPLIGAAFSLFLYSIISAGVVSVEKIVPDDEDSSNKMFFYISISFVAGFSEQFARSYIRKTEELLGGDLQDKRELLDELNKIKVLREDLDSLRIDLSKITQEKVEQNITASNENNKLYRK